MMHRKELQEMLEKQLRMLFEIYENAEILESLNYLDAEGRCKVLDYADTLVAGGKHIKPGLAWLRKLRAGRSVYTLADEIGISQSVYASIECGSRKPSVKMAKKIAAAMGFDWTRFFEDETDCDARPGA